jgi:hypothetical protein
LVDEVLDPLLSAWLGEAILIPGLVPMSVRAFLTCLPHTWHWPARPYIDPTTEAAADTARLTNGTTTLAAVCAARGDDWQEVIRQRAREQQYAAQVAAELNVPAPAAPTAAVHGRELPLAIAAAAKPSGLRIVGTAPLRLKAAAVGDGVAALRRFDMIAYTGGPMLLEGFDRPVIVDLAGMTVPSPRRPVLRDHLAFRIVGHTDDIRVGSTDLAVAGVISGTGPHVDEIVHLADNGFPWQCSIGASAEQVEFVGDGQTVEVNGQTFTGPVYVARRTSSKKFPLSLTARTATRPPPSPLPEVAL